MQFTPADCLTFQYKADSHLQTTLTIKNTGSASSGFKFKVTTTNKFHINPNVGMLKGGTEVKVNIAIHRDIVDRIDEERIQILYGDKYQESQYFALIVENGSKSDRLNLTMIVHEKEEQILKIKKEINDYRNIPINTLPQKKKEKSQIVTLVIVGIIGVLLGYFIPFKVFG